MKKIILIILVVVFLGAIFIWWGGFFSSNEEPTIYPGAEEAELVAFNFMLDFVALASPTATPALTDRLYQSLTKSAQGQVDRNFLERDLAVFIGVKAVPDFGASVEDLEIQDVDRATLVVGLNYASERIIREVNLIAEEGEWKVDSVTDTDRPEFLY